MLAIDWLALAFTLAIVAVAIDLARFKPGRDILKEQKQAEAARKQELITGRFLS